MLAHRAGSISGIKVTRPSPGPIVRASGPVPSRLYVLGERAGKNEFLQGAPFVGCSGDTLREWFHCAELDLDNFRRWNVCIDYKEGNLHPQRWEIDRDRAEVKADIARCQPDVIAAVGAYAMKWCLQGLKTRPKLGEEHGRPVDIQIGDHKAVCVPVYHPSRLQRGERLKMGKADVLKVAEQLRQLA